MKTSLVWLVRDQCSPKKFFLPFRFHIYCCEHLKSDKWKKPEAWVRVNPTSELRQGGHNNETMAHWYNGTRGWFPKYSQGHSAVMVIACVQSNPIHSIKFGQELQNNCTNKFLWGRFLKCHFDNLLWPLGHTVSLGYLVSDQLHSTRQRFNFKKCMCSNIHWSDDSDARMIQSNVMWPTTMIWACKCDY